MSSWLRRRAAQAASMGRRPHRNLERNESSVPGWTGGGCRWGCWAVHKCGTAKQQDVIC